MKKTATKPKDAQYKNISPETASLIDAFKKTTKEIISSKGSRDFLVQTGVYTKSGKLSKAYR
jgi:hypothetical protein